MTGGWSTVYGGKRFVTVKFLVNGQVLAFEVGLTLTVVVNSIASVGCMVSNLRIV